MLVYDRWRGPLCSLYEKASFQTSYRIIAVFSLIDITKANKLDSYGYIEFILEYLPQQDLIGKRHIK